MAQQTAMQEAIEYLKLFNLEASAIILEDRFLEKEKGQMYKCASFWRGKENEIEKPIFDLYYNETYNK